MSGHMGGSVSGYSNALNVIRVFFRDFLGRGDLVEGFRFPSEPFRPKVVPGREELREFYDEIPTIEGRLYFMLYATSGLRRKEGLSLGPENVDEDIRMMTPNKGLGGTKNTWVTFYNDEMEGLLEDYTPQRRKRWIPIKTDDFQDIWRVPHNRTGIRITSAGPEGLVLRGDGGGGSLGQVRGRLLRAIAEEHTGQALHRLLSQSAQENLR